MKIILASSSRYRQNLLKKIIPDFEVHSPDIDESRYNQESPAELANRLAYEKTRAVAQRQPEALIIGSDQVAWLDNTQLCKPLNKQAAIQQLVACQGKTAQFYTGICLLNSKTGKRQTSVERYETTFRTLSTEQITAYVNREPALNCAGGFKMEGLGIALFEKIRGDDPNSLIGLPLIRLINMLENEGISVL